jgi:6-phosphogluconolactonase
VRLASLLLLAACGDPMSHAGDVTPPMVDAPASAHWVAYVGGYGGEISWYSVDQGTGALAMLGSIPATTPSFLAFDDTFTHLYAVDESNSRVGAYAIDQGTGALTAIGDAPSGGSGPAHVAYADEHVLVANYGDGAVTVFVVVSDGGLGASQTRNAGANAHEIAVAGQWAFVPCLGSDYVAQYGWSGAALTPNPVPHFAPASGAGPRHLAFAGSQAYLIDEKASTIMALALDQTTGQLSEIQTLSSRGSAATGANTGAEIAVRGGYVYASNRGDDTIAVFGRDLTTGRLSPVTQVPTGGETPRHFSLSPDGRLLFVANQGSNTVVPFAIDPATGIPAAVATPVTVQAPTFVGIAVLP